MMDETESLRKQLASARAAVDQSSWKWFGHAGHLIVSSQCRFHLCTQVGRYLISTVGDYYPHRTMGRDTLGAEKDSFFETYVFIVCAGTSCQNAACLCNMPNVDFDEIDSIRCATAGQAMHTHMMICSKYQQEEQNNYGGEPESE